MDDTIYHVTQRTMLGNSGASKNKTECVYEALTRATVHALESVFNYAQVWQGRDNEIYRCGAAIEDDRPGAQVSFRAISNREARCWSQTGVSSPC